MNEDVNTEQRPGQAQGTDRDSNRGSAQGMVRGTGNGDTPPELAETRWTWIDPETGERLGLDLRASVDFRSRLVQGGFGPAEALPSDAVPSSSATGACDDAAAEGDREPGAVRGDCAGGEFGGRPGSEPGSAPSPFAA